MTIMPFGDCMTKGKDGTGGGCRLLLHNMLVDRNVSFRFVGDLTNESDGLPENQRGHCGTVADMVVNYVPGGSMNNILYDRLKLRPDIILLKMGIVDILKGVNSQTFEISLNYLLKTIHDNLPNTHILLSNIIPSEREDLTHLVRSFNLIISHIVNRKLLNKYKIYFVDVANNFPLDGFASDCIHCNMTGYDWIAKQWLSALKILGYVEKA